jgi:hypothetical protein
MTDVLSTAEIAAFKDAALHDAQHENELVRTMAVGLARFVDSHEYWRLETARLALAVVEVGGRLTELEAATTAVLDALAEAYAEDGEQPLGRALSPMVMLRLRARAACAEARRGFMVDGVPPDPTPVVEACPSCGGTLRMPFAVYSGSYPCPNEQWHVIVDA